MGGALGRLPIKRQRLWGPGESLMATFSLRDGETEDQRWWLERALLCSKQTVHLCS